MLKRRLPLITVFLGLTIGYFLSRALIHAIAHDAISSQFIILSFILVVTIVLTGQSVFTLIWMLYAWEDPGKVAQHRSPEKFLQPKHSFTALIPARHEESVIADTIQAVNNIDYPKNLMEILILCREDDTKTIEKVRQTIKHSKIATKLVIFNDTPINKPHALNIGLEYAKNEVIAVFDAEDEPHSNIYNVANTAMISRNADVIQSGVQLMNYRSYWFSALNCLEYFFWFKSGLHFFTNIGKTTPLGGNTVFFKKDYLEKIGGWDEHCLTEDADIGIRLTAAGAKIGIIYDEKYATQEETPDSIRSFIKQRTRWNQGFLQIFLKDNWTRLPTFRQKIVAALVLLTPELQSAMLIYLPLAVIFSLTNKLPVAFAMLSFLPAVTLILQMITLCIGLYEFCRAYKLPFPIWMPIHVAVTFIPYQMLLMFASLRAVVRFIFSIDGWEKTLHLNAHRKATQDSYAV